MSRLDLKFNSTSYEKSIGLTARVTTSVPAWSGILRHRWTDFMVNEIQKDGMVVHLRACSLETPQNRPENSAAASLPAEKPDIPQVQLKTLEELTSEEFVRQVIELYKAPTVGQDGKRIHPKPAMSDPILDKAQRAQIHQEIRKVFNSEIDTTTSDDCIRATSKPGKRTKSRNEKARTHIDCPGHGEHLHFTMFKENRDTIEVTQLLRKMMNIKSSVLVAGTKDRRAATTQRCSVKLRTAAELSALNRKLVHVKTGDYERRPIALRMGELQGNEFTIVVKDCHLANDEELPVLDRVAAFKAILEPARRHMYEHGWINYFGHQRFGTWDIRTHQVGMFIIGGRYEAAVKSILYYDPKVIDNKDVNSEYKRSGRSDECSRAQCIKTFEDTQDSTAALKNLAPRFNAERAIIGHLGRGASVAKDFPGALLKVPRTLRTLYMHSYQSLVWNHAAAKRWELYGSNVVEGDLVAIEPRAPERDTEDQDGGEVVFPDDPEDQDPGAVTAHVVTAEEAAAGKFSIFNVILPSPGYATKLPTNEVREFYKEFMGRPENGGIDAENMPRHHKDFSVEGKYRRLMGRFLAEPEFEVRAYADNNEQLFPTDLDLIIEKTRREDQENLNKGGAQKDGNNKRQREIDGNGMAEGEAGLVAKKAKVDRGEEADAAAANADVGVAPVDVDKPVDDDAHSEKSDKVAVILKFRLGRGAYATVVARELGLSGDEIS